MDSYLLLSGASFIAGWILNWILENSTKNEGKNFQTIFINVAIPACIVDENGIIRWHNGALDENFPQKTKINKEFTEIFHPQKVLGHVEICALGRSWIIEHVEINKKFGIIFTPAKPLDLQWWSDIPYPIGVLDSKGMIKGANAAFKEMLGKNHLNKAIKIWAPKFDFSKASLDRGQEILWHSTNGTAPMLAWVKEYGDRRLVLLENRSEFVKLKNQAQEAHHLQILGQLAGGIIHDFNNLLTAISGFTDLLEPSMPNNEMLNEIRRNTEQAANLSRELLHFVKLKPVETHNTKVSEFVNKLELMLKKLLGERISLEIEANEEGRVNLSETQLEQIILNMALNSKDAMPNGGTFKIKVKEETVDKKLKKTATLEPGKYLILSISDTGGGIPKQHAQKIFSPFFSTKLKGTGLGLSSCLRIIQHAGGSINVQSSRKGTTFEIYLPISEEPKNENKAKIHEEEIKDGKNKVLIFAEDEETIRNLAQKALTQNGYKVYAFGNGKDALKALETIKADGLITDAVLPAMDGIKLAHEAKRLNPKMPVLIVSGYSMEDIENHIPKNVEFLPKPFTLKILKETVQRIFQ